MENTLRNSEVTINVDLLALKAQKKALLEIQQHIDSFDDELTGIINFIDNIQDYAVDKLGLPENEVFDFTNEDIDEMN